jgi:imipenem/basic amino acid-specific outer membrane pore
MKQIIKLSIITALTLSSFSTTIFANNLIYNAFKNAKTSGNIRIGHSNDSDMASTSVVGGYFGFKTVPINNISMKATFFTTHTVAKKDANAIFLDSKNNGYSILGEAYLEANFNRTNIKYGRQIIDTPYANSDDFAMVPNTFEGFTFVNTNIKDTTVILASIDKMAGVDAKIAEDFTDIQINGDAIKTAAIIYEGVKNLSVQAWSYDIPDKNIKYNYFEAGYEVKLFNIAIQKATQGNGNSAVGAVAGINIKNLALSIAHNKATGEVSNGFGGGPFFTSAASNSIDGKTNEKATLVSAKYSIGAITTSITNINFNKSEDEIDYVLSYSANNNLTIDFILANMNDDGNFTRVFANYSF